MAQAFRQFSFAIQALCLAHLVAIAQQSGDDVVHLVHSFCLVCRNSFLKLLQTQLHVVEVGDGFAKGFGQIDQHFLEVSESFSARE